ncbi:MAG: hypothetical protein PHD73_02940, partial [Sediminibacterium sp.]|nr:hypothetical protein [Sediminibacterium sp.]
MKKLIALLFLLPLFSAAQLKWTNVDALFQPLPEGMHVFVTEDSLDGKPNKAYYVSASLKQPSIR